MKRFAVLGCILFCTIAPFSSAQAAVDVPEPGAAAAAESGSSSAEGPEESGPDLTELSIALLLEAAGDGHSAWRPGWPPDLPPDLFYIPGALSVRIDFDGGETLELVMEGERFRAFPVLTRTGLIQGRCEYDDRGRLFRLSWESGGGAEADRRRAGADAAAGRGWGEGDAEVVERDGGGQPVLWRIFSGAYYFAALEYNGAAASETWYDEGGKALFALESGPRGTTRIFSSPSGGGPAAGPVRTVTTVDYNNGGLISAVTGNGETVSALYNARGMPRYLEISRDGGIDQNADQNTDRNPGEDQDAEPPREFYVYQWDEAGRLIRLSGGPDGLDYRYEYTLDDRGNWTERRELRMEAIGPGETGPEARLVPAAVRTIRRTIRYAGSSGEK